MKFIHAADIHLGSPFNGIKKVNSEAESIIKGATTNAFNQLIDDAIDEKIDFLLIVGDLFDSPNPDTLTLDTAISGFERLNTGNIPVYLSFGNHDYLNAQIPTELFPANVHIYDANVSTKELVTKDGVKVGIVGFSYKSRAEYDSRVEEYPIDLNVDYKIGTLHGSMDGVNSPEAHYAPFTKQQLLQKNYDYWALGHIHKRQTLNDQPIIQYSGNIQGRHINEPGLRGYYLNTVTNNQTNSEFKSTSAVVWDTLAIRADKTDDLPKLIDKISEKSAKQNLFQVTNILIKDGNLLPELIVQQIEDGVLLTRLNSQSQDNIWFNRVTLKITPSEQFFSELDREYWTKAAGEVFQTTKLQELANKLIQYDFIEANLAQPSKLSELKDLAELKLKQQHVFEDSDNEN